MLCPKCKREIADKTLKCNFCNAKVGSLCKKCGAYNLITATECGNCGNVLIKKCTECGGANLPNAKKCRKCGIEFVEVEKTKETKPTYSSATSSQVNVKAKLVEGIKDANTRIITVSGDSGCGKNLVLRTALAELKQARITYLYGTCTQVSQLSPFGYIQDLLLSFFNINNFCADTLLFKKNSIKFFKQDFPSLTTSEVLDLLNLLYPEILDRYENIYYNKAKYFSILKKVFLTILEKTKVIFIIDNFEFIDGNSFDFIKELLELELTIENSKVIILNKDSRPGLGLLPTKILTEENYLDLSIASFTATQVETLLKQYNDLKLGKDFANFAYKISNGNPSIIEQIIFLKRDLIRCGIKNIEYNSLDSIIKLRLEILRQEDWNAYRMLIAMSVLGIKFYPAMLENFDNNSSQEFDRIIGKLVDNAYITVLNNTSFEFKSQDIWKSIISVVKEDPCFEEVVNILLELLSMYKQSSIALLAFILQKLNNNDQAFDVWTLLMKQASYIGDIGLYIISQKQALRLIENKANPFYQKVRKNIYTRVGKLLEPIDHEASFEYLQQAIMMLEDDEDPEHIELLGYLASCSMKNGNYWGVIECIDNVLNKLPDSMHFEKVLVKSRQVKPLLKLGNYGQIINMIETEVLQELEKNLSRGKNTPQISIDDLFKLWIDIYYDFAEALIYQGDNRAFEVIQEIYEILDRNKQGDQALICKTHLLLALANTIKGDTEASVQILDDILKEFTLDSMDDFIISRWNFIDVLNKFFNKNYKTLQADLFNVAAFANNINDAFTKNILKTMLAKILKDNNENKRALEILEEQVAYFAKEKVATGVLLSWYLISEIKLITSGTQFALDIATKALDIAQSPNINNYYFIALFNKLIGEIYLAKQDFDSAKVYLEKTIFIAKQFDLQFILVKAYVLCAKLYQELALPKTSLRNNYIKQALKMFQTAKNVPIVASQKALQKNIKDELNILTSFCKLNGIVLKKESK